MQTDVKRKGCRVLFVTLICNLQTTTMVVSDLQYTAMELQRGKRIVESHIEYVSTLCLLQTMIV